MNAAEGLSSKAEAAGRKVPRLNQNVPVAEVLITPMRSVYIGSTLIPIRIPRSSLLNPQREFGITISTGRGGISENATWILLCTKTTRVRVCNESGFARRSFPHSQQVNPLVESDLSHGVGIPLRTVVAIPLHKQTRSHISWLTSATTALVNLTQIVAKKNSMLVGR